MPCLVSLFTPSDTFRTNIPKFISLVCSQGVDRCELSSNGTETISRPSCSNKRTYGEQRRFRTQGLSRYEITISKFYAACSIIQWTNTTTLSKSSDSRFTQRESPISSVQINTKLRTFMTKAQHKPTRVGLPETDVKHKSSFLNYKRPCSEQSDKISKSTLAHKRMKLQGNSIGTRPKKMRISQRIFIRF